jgi:hypothetical protein
MIITAIAQLRSASPYSQSRYYNFNVPKLKGETSADYEVRTWREKCHAEDDGSLFIPGMALKNCVSEAAKFLGLQIPGKGKATYTKHIEAGVMVLSHLALPVNKRDVEGEWLYMNADGRRGGNVRVMKCFPLIREWSGRATFTIVSPVVTEEVFRQHLEEAGKYIGIGRWRPRMNGLYGRFTLDDLVWRAA